MRHSRSRAGSACPPPWQRRASLRSKAANGRGCPCAGGDRDLSPRRGGYGPSWLLVIWVAAAAFAAGGSTGWVLGPILDRERWIASAAPPLATIKESSHGECAGRPAAVLQPPYLHVHQCAARGSPARLLHCPCGGGRGCREATRLHAREGAATGH